MYDDVSQLRDFYASPLGQLARRIIARRIRAHWDNVSNMDVVGLGYASPFLQIFNGEARVTAALMPHRQGVRAMAARRALSVNLGLRDRTPHSRYIR